MVVLDTHVALWLLAGEERLTSAPAFRYIEQASQRGALRIAAISLFELSRLAAKGAVRFELPLSDVFETLLETPGLQVTPIDQRIALEALSLDSEFPGDEIDRVICATSRSLRADLLTANPRLIDFARNGTIRVIPVS